MGVLSIAICLSSFYVELRYPDVLMMLGGLRTLTMSATIKRRLLCYAGIHPASQLATPDACSAIDHGI